MILIVEDDILLGESLEDILQSEGYRTQRATNGKIALSLLAANDFRPNLILLDLQMPEMDGLTFLSELRGRTSASALPNVLLMTAARELNLSQALPYPVIGKPFDLDLLLERVETLGSPRDAI